jgi:hypothetical protein
VGLDVGTEELELGGVAVAVPFPVGIAVPFALAVDVGATVEEVEAAQSPVTTWVASAVHEL